MHNSKTIDLLKSFTTEELHNFSVYLQSPFYNKSKKLIQLFSMLRKHSPDFVSSKLDKRILFKSLYKDESYCDKKMRDRISILNHHLIQYLSLIQFTKQNYLLKLCAVRELSHRGLDKIFSNCVQKISHMLKSQKIKDDDYFIKKLELESIVREYYELRQLLGKCGKTYGSLSSEEKDIYSVFAISILKTYLKMYNVESSLNFEHSLEIAKRTISFIQENKDMCGQSPIVDVLHEFLKLYICEESCDFESLKKILDTNRTRLSKALQRDLYIDLYNYCKKREQNGEIEFGERALALIKEIESNNLLLRGNTLDVQSYINSVATAIRKHDFGWAVYFNEKYKMFLPLEEKQNAYNYNLAVIEYMKGKNVKKEKEKKFHYGKALESLALVQSKDFYYMARIKNLFLIIYYENNNFNEGMSMIDSYMHNLKSDTTIPFKVKVRYKNFTYFVNKLFQIREQNAFIKINIIKERLNNEVNVEYKNWLHDKIIELENAKK
ncbi:MAG: hypothetical protein EHM58_02405 [Ignavibacteriae bacterium]|nr:MAG: hypothetical protein EHM58_02405 [Ignavibacteriota bacterium]